MRRRQFVVLGIIAAAALIGLSLLSRIQISPTDSVPPEKQTFEARLDAREVAGVLTQNAYIEMGTTGPLVAGYTPPAHCAGPTREVGIWLDTHLHTPLRGVYTVNWAVARASTGDLYVIGAGRPAYNPFLPQGADNPKIPYEGMLIVQREPLDPCATKASGPYQVEYKTPRGPLTILKIDGDVVEYGIEGGGTGRFNYVKGEFLP